MGRVAVSQSAWLRYGIAVLSTAIASVVSAVILPTLVGVPSGLLILSVLASCWYGGLGAGFLASALGAVAYDYFFIAPRYSFEITSPSSLLNLAAFLSVELFIAYLTSFVRRDLTRRDRSQAELQRLTEELESRARAAEDGLRDLSVVQDASQAILSVDDPATLGEQLLDRAMQIGPYDVGMLRFARDDGSLEVAAHRGYRDLDNVPPPIPNAGTIYSVLTSQIAKVTEDIRGNQAYPRLEQEGLVSVVVCPITAHSEALGILTLGMRSHHYFQPTEVKLLEAIAMQAGIALQKTRLHAATVRANADLAGSLSVLEATLESTADGLLVVDNNGSMVRFNQKFVDMWRLPESILASRDDEQAISFVLDQLVDPDAFTARVRELYARPDTESFETLELKDGRVFERYSQPQRIGDEWVGRVWSFRDISQRRNIERQLLRAQRLETAGRISGQVAHDFNNLLSPLVGFSELIKLQLPEDHRAQHYCDLMIQAAEQMAQINQDLLTMGRRGHFDQVSVNLNEIIEQVIAQLSPMPPTLVVDLQLAEQLLPVSAAPAQLARVVTNLVVNAREAMQEIGALTLRTSNVYVDRPAGRMVQVAVGEYVRLEVTDTGGGIAPDILDKIFDAFFTTRPPERRRGAGLGLSVVQAVVEDHRGYVDVATEAGRGTTFSVYLPITRTPIAHPESAPIIGGAESILVVDDDPFQRAVASELLTSLGYTVSVASSGEEALTKLEAEPADLLLLDMVMPPGIDGAKTFEEVKRRNPEQRAILLSGFAQTERVRAAQDAGAGAFLHKPVTRETLAAAVRTELERKATPSAVAPPYENVAIYDEKAASKRSR
jgi:signal transduction histidine kinase/ActR/RegA family two-component response regulator